MTFFNLGHSVQLHFTIGRFIINNKLKLGDEKDGTMVTKMKIFQLVKGQGIVILALYIF
ncbi:hypothetical protein FC46_GL001735 [Lactobacillus kalixensis DSM 16043]|uniref:Uncharacterized protein n=2 Tax=Lactobacillus kalixensis TaxID=227944 RepID=A0A0R1U2I6_9LACO|nr:hypothetical protein FC46_GL001735 [Lactobacillus kalixensis DSM 16043]